MDTLRIRLSFYLRPRFKRRLQDKGIPALEIEANCADHARKGPAALNS